MAAATSIVPATMIGPNEFGRDVSDHQTRTRDTERARRLDEFLFAQRQELRAHEPRDLHPPKSADHRDDQNEGAELGSD